MCGNGGRCLVAFAAHRGIKKFEFNAIDGYHIAEVLEYTPHRCIVKLKMTDLEAGDKYSENAYFLNTGSPHYVEFVEDTATYPVDEKGKYWRYHPDFVGGTNVNFVQIKDNCINVRTYERGVEAETFACGTGVTASSIATYLYNPDKGFATREQVSEDVEAAKYDIHALGDDLSVSFKYNKSSKAFTDVYLTGPATFVFECDIEID
jgi:diaminopimelate epimerase